jgi:hypothetical protein
VDSGEALDVLLGFGRSEDLQGEIEVISRERKDRVAHLKMGRPNLDADIIPLEIRKPNGGWRRTAIFSYRQMKEILKLEGGASSVRRALIIGNAAEQLNVDALAHGTRFSLATDRNGFATRTP